MATADATKSVVSAIKTSSHARKKKSEKFAISFSIIAISVMSLLIFGLLYDVCFRQGRHNLRAGNKARRLAEGEDGEGDNAPFPDCGAETDEDERAESDTGEELTPEEYEAWQKRLQEEREANLRSDDTCLQVLSSKEKQNYGGEYSFEFHEVLGAEAFPVLEEGQTLLEIAYKNEGDLQTIIVRTANPDAPPLQTTDSLKLLPEAKLISQALHCGNGEGGRVAAEKMRDKLPAIYGPLLTEQELEENPEQTIRLAIAKAQDHLNAELFEDPEVDPAAGVSSATFLFQRYPEDQTLRSVYVSPTGFPVVCQFAAHEPEMVIPEVEEAEEDLKEDQNRAQEAGVDVVQIERFERKYVALRTGAEGKEKDTSLRQLGRKDMASGQTKGLFSSKPYAVIKETFVSGDIMLAANQEVQSSYSGDFDLAMKKIFNHEKSESMVGIAMEVMSLPGLGPEVERTLMLTRGRYRTGEGMERNFRCIMTKIPDAKPLTAKDLYEGFDTEGSDTDTSDDEASDHEASDDEASDDGAAAADT